MNEQQVAENAISSTPPALNLIFDGLFFLCFNTEGNPAPNDPAGECRIGFVTTAPPHKIIISGKRTFTVGDVTQTTEFERTYTHTEARRIQIDLIVPGVESPSVTRRGHPTAINRQTPTDSNKEFFKWIIDLENHELHNTKLSLIRGALRPVMHIPIGEFYTKDLSRVKYFRTRVDSDRSEFGNVAEKTGVRINTLPRNIAQLRLGETIIDLVTKPGETCEVKFKNRCPQCDERNLGSLHFSDFPEHYNAFDVGILDQYDFDFDEPPALPPAICYAASGSRTTDI